MQNTLIRIEGDIFTELERIQLEHAMLEEPLGEICVFCGSNEGISVREMMSTGMKWPMELAICKKCNEKAGKRMIEDFLDDVENNDPTLWSKIIMNNIRKTDWISKVVFDHLRGGLKGKT